MVYIFQKQNFCKPGYIYIYIFGLVMGHQTMLNLELEDHTGGDLGYLNSLCNRLFCFGQEPTQDIRKNIYFRSFGLAAFFGDTLVTKKAARPKRRK